MKDYWILSLTKDRLFEYDDNIYVQIPKNVSYDEIFKLVNRIHNSFSDLMRNKMRRREFSDNDIIGPIKPIEVFFILNNLKKYLREHVFYKNEQEFSDDNSIKAICLRDVMENRIDSEDDCYFYYTYNRAKGSYKIVEKEINDDYESFDFTDLLVLIFQKREQHYRKYEDFLMKDVYL